MKQQGYSKLCNLVIAVKHNNVGVVKVFLDNGADPNKKFNNSELPLFIALKNDNLIMLDILIKAGANINIEDSRGETPLMKSVYRSLRDNNSMMEVLIEVGADVNYKNKYGKDIIDEVLRYYWVGKENKLCSVIEILCKNNLKTHNLFFNVDEVYNTHINFLADKYKASPLSNNNSWITKVLNNKSKGSDTKDFHKECVSIK